MTTTAVISPLTRIEGHLAIHTDVEKLASGDLRITSARCEGEMYRGFEKILEGRDPLDAQQITQRICGVCPISHGLASCQAQEMAYGISPTNNGRIMQNLIFAANYIQSHVLHFYHLAALDFVDIKSILKYNGSDHKLKSLRAWVEGALARNDTFAAAPFLPRYEVDQYVKSDEANWGLIASYVQALRMRSIAHEMAAVFGAKLPHSTALVPSGVTETATIERILAYKTRLNQLATFIEETYIPDLVTAAGAFPQYWDIGASYGNYLSYGVFRLENTTGEKTRKFLPAGTIINGQWKALNPSQIFEYVQNSRFSSSSGLHPFRGQTEPSPSKGYSWLKAPRYDGNVMEVGPLARIMVGYHTAGFEWIKKEVDAVLGSLQIPVEKMNSVLGRHLSRGLEAKWIAHQAYNWLDELEIGGASAKDYELPKNGQGYGLTEAPRGALGHWVVIDNYVINRYQCVVPTTWNCSPRDDKGQPGAVEKALEGTLISDVKQPIEAGRIVRSFDPCLACAVH
ncbi:MAG: nickel-dependent hydrogenase large subunit [Sedimentisphaerales bacterium]|nr:nickel-dependent hydrogenase large subunit [Sedimentisphaerales bacterium]